MAAKSTDATSTPNWADKYNLNNKIFLEIALWAIPDKRDHPKQVEDMKSFAKKMGKQMPWKFPEWSITDAIYYEYEEEDSNRKVIDIQPNKTFPFIFTPGIFNLNRMSISNSNIEARDYEQILVNYHLDVSFALKGEKEKIRGFVFGDGWDPRMDTWSEFEENIDALYKKYKELYKARTESYMEEQGYIEGKQKRNKNHFEWLVRYQIQEWSIKEIADHYSKENTILAEDTIKKALISTAKLLDLEIR